MDKVKKNASIVKGNPQDDGDVMVFSIPTNLFEDTCLTPEIYQYWAHMKKRTIIINGDIDSSLIEYAVLPLMGFINDGTNLPAEIILNTDGGDVDSGFALVDVIERCTIPLTIRIVGRAASMGAFIAMAGHNNPNVKTVCSFFSIGLIHSGSQILAGSTHAVRDTLHFTERTEDRIKQYVLTHTNIDEAMFAKIERQEFWMDSDDMLKYGIVQEVV